MNKAVVSAQITALQNNSSPMSLRVFSRRRQVTAANLEGAASVLTSSQDYRWLALPNVTAKY
jgi:hypothetical protein